jgi:outer membrane protein assembly factor BamB
VPRTARVPLTVLAAAGFVVSLSTVVSPRAIDDWPQWRGLKRDGTSAERGLLKTWPAAGPPLAWRATGAGDG